MNEKVHPVGEQEARDVAEAARESGWRKPSVAKELFAGRLRLDLVHPLPEESAEQRRKGELFLEKLRRFVEAVATLAGIGFEHLMLLGREQSEGVAADGDAPGPFPNLADRNQWHSIAF